MVSLLTECILRRVPLAVPELPAPRAVVSANNPSTSQRTRAEVGSPAELAYVRRKIDAARCDRALLRLQPPGRITRSRLYLDEVSTLDRYGGARGTHCSR